jgi:hypothetical protein
MKSRIKNIVNLKFETINFVTYGPVRPQSLRSCGRMSGGFANVLLVASRLRRTLVKENSLPLNLSVCCGLLPLTAAR